VQGAPWRPPPVRHLRHHLRKTSGARRGIGQRADRARGSRARRLCLGSPPHGHLFTPAAARGEALRVKHRVLGSEGRGGNTLPVP
jgi:hypothetical protein